jgi:hypothetical protein
MRKPTLLVPLFLVLGLLSGCAGPHNCTLAGATSGVTFHLDAILKGARSPIQATACVEAKCVPVTISPGNGTLVVVNDPSLTSVRPVAATLTVFAADRQIFNGSTSVQLHKLQPNGPDCDPTVYVASVTATTAGGAAARQIAPSGGLALGPLRSKEAL